MSKAVVWSGKFLDTVVDGGWEYVRRKQGRGAALVIAETGSGALLLVEQHRPPLGGPCLEFPAGLIDDGEHGEDAARRELEEETGYRADSIESLGEFVSSPGLASESFTLYRARGLVRTGEGGGLDDEDIAVFEVPKAEIPGFVAAKRRQGVAIDARLVVALGLV